MSPQKDAEKVGTPEKVLGTVNGLAGSQAGVEAVDLGLDVARKPFRLLDADITSDQLLQLRQDPSRLPPGWPIDGASNSARREA
jgi:hypothetical protein